MHWRELFGAHVHVHVHLHLRRSGGLVQLERHTVRRSEPTAHRTDLA